MDDLDRKIAEEAARAFSEWIDERAALFPDMNVWPPAACDSERAGMRALLRAVVRLCDARYQPRADAPYRHGTNSCRLRGLEHDRDRCIVWGQPHADVKPEEPAKDGAQWPFPCAPIDDAEREAVASPGPSACGASAPTNAVVCTRRDAHDGDHVASDGRQVLNRWPSTKPAAPPPDDATEEAAKIMASAMGYAETVHAIAAALRLRSEVRIGTGEFAWLIEDATGAHPLYWSGGDSWTHDHDTAIRFSREVDAERVLRCLPRADRLAAREHGWCSPLVALVARDGEGR